MAKYITISTTNDGVLQAPIADGMMARLRSATIVEVFSSAFGSNKLELTCTGANQALIDNINAAIRDAAETNWRDVLSPVTVPAGVTVADYEVKVVS